MPHVCDVSYKISEALHSDPREKNKLVRIIIRSAAKQILLAPYYTVKRVINYLTNANQYHKV